MNCFKSTKILLLCLFALSMSSSAFDFDNIVNLNVERVIDLRSSLVGHRITVIAKNVGNQTLSHYLVAIPQRLNGNIGLFSFTDGKSSQYISPSEGELFVTKEQSFYIYNILLEKKLEEKEERTFLIDLHFGGLLKPLYSKLSFDDDQWVSYVDSYYWSSPYETERQDTMIEMSSENSYVVEEGRKVEGSKMSVVYGKISGLETKFFELLMEYESPIFVIKKLFKKIEISTWGNLAVEDYTELKNEAMEQSEIYTKKKPAVSGFELKPPKERTSTYYRDSIGTIFALSESGRDSLALRFRFPIFGGWKTSFSLGYNLKLSKYLKVSGSDTYQFSFPIDTGHANSVFIEEQAWNIVLPQGSTDIHVHFPCSANFSQSLEFRYLDTIGRPRISVSKTPFTTTYQPNQTLTVNFKLSPSYFLLKPSLLFFGLYTVFLVFILFRHLSLSILPTSLAGARGLNCHLLKYKENILDRLSYFKTLESQAKLQGYTYNSAKKSYIQKEKSAILLLSKIQKNSPKVAQDIEKIEVLLAKKADAQDDLHDAIFKNTTPPPEKIYYEHDSSIQKLLSTVFP